MNRFRKWKQPKMEHGKFTKWNWLPYHPKNIKMGKNVDIGAFSCLFAHNGITLEEDVQIGSHCSIYSYNTINNTAGKVTIKKGARIGSFCLLLPGVVIEENEFIRAYSVVYMKDGKRCIK